MCSFRSPVCMVGAKRKEGSEGVWYLSPSGKYLLRHPSGAACEVVGHRPPFLGPCQLAAPVQTCMTARQETEAAGKWRTGASQDRLCVVMHECHQPYSVPWWKSPLGELSKQCLHRGCTAPMQLPEPSRGAWPQGPESPTGPQVWRCCRPG